MENQMVHAIPFAKRRKTWALISGNAISLLSDLDILFNGPFSHHVKFYSFIFIHKISTRVVCVNGKHP